jgi:hypothetical protein
MLEAYEAHHLTLTAEPNQTTQKRKLYGNYVFKQSIEIREQYKNVQETFCYRRHFIKETFFRRHCVYRHFVCFREDILSRMCFVWGVLPNKPNCINTVSWNLSSRRYEKNIFNKSFSLLNFQNVLFRMFFCYYCHKAVAIACSVTKLLTHSSMFKKLN